jgi:hypothetical protein
MPEVRGASPDERILASLGAHSAQGFLYSEAVPEDVMTDFVVRAARGEEWRPGTPPVVMELPTLPVPA